MYLVIMFFILSILNISLALASVYKCEIDNVVTYSQFPCSDTAEKIKVRVTKSSSRIKNSNNKMSHKNQLEDTNLYIRISQVDRKIRESNNRIKTNQRKMKQEVKQLQIRTRYANNNLAGATYESALSTQMSAVTTKYNSLIEIEQKSIERLYEEKELLVQRRSKLKDEESISQSVLMPNKPELKENNIDLYIQNAKNKREKLAHQNKIKKYRRKMKQEIEQLKFEASFANNNLAGARYEGAKSEKMNAVANKYNTLINIEQQKLDMLHKESKRLNKR